MMTSSSTNQHTPVEENKSNLTSASGEASGSYDNNINNNNINVGTYSPHYDNPHPSSNPQPSKKRRNQPGHPDPDAEVVALSPRTLLATNRFVCDVCNKGFQRDQNLQLHRRGHNLPWKLKQRNNKEVIKKKVYVCPEPSCVHHDRSRALGDLTGIKKHFCRKHGEKKWKCDKCSKKYAVQSDWKAHSKTCGTREYRCDCGTLFSRRDSFITHRAFCDALAEESARSTTLNNRMTTSIPQQNTSTYSTVPIINNPSSITHHMKLQQLQSQFNNNNSNQNQELTFQIKKEQHQNFPPWLSFTPPPQLTMVGSRPQHIDLATSSILFQDFQQHNDHTTHHHDQDHHNSNPNPSTLGPTTTTTLLPPYTHPPTPPHISATALLQKATQLGAKSSSSTTTAKNQSLLLPSSLQQGGGGGVFITTATTTQSHQNEVSSASDSAHCCSTTTSSTTVGKFGLNLSSFDQFVNGLTSFGNNKAAVMSSCTSVSHACETSNNYLLHDMMMSNGTNDDYGLVGSTAFEDVAFGGILIGTNNINNNHDHLHHALAKKEDNHVILHGDADDDKNHQVGGGGEIKHDEMMMTRDFLGLRPLSESDMLSITGLSNCMSNDHSDHLNQVQKSWQDN